MKPKLRSILYNWLKTANCGYKNNEIENPINTEVIKMDDAEKHLYMSLSDSLEKQIYLSINDKPQK